ncbi:MAG: F0F1 ATP synthase subunit delta [Nitrospiraceae bacterium]|nr:F0F1 ATP synthase subunit delta [Nitrospiraceae bacterium]
MTSTVIAKRYAKALFAAAKEEGKLEDFSQALKEIDASLEKNPDIESTLISPIFPADLKHSVINGVIEALSIKGTLVNFLKLLVDRRRIQHLRQIVDSFQGLIDEEMGIVRAVVQSAVPLSGDLQKKFAEALAQVTGKQVTLQIEEDPAIVGGVVARVGDMVWDGSIRSQLQNIRESIGRGELG